MSTETVVALICGAFPFLVGAIVVMWKYIVRMHKERNELTEKLLTVMSDSTAALGEITSAAKDLSTEIRGLKTNTLLQTQVLEQIQRKR